MGLTSGNLVGPYEILAPLGAGGMGEVWRARDTKLNREVALKVLPERVGRDPERMARFQREAQVLAALNHPNIAAIYGLEESSGVRALVMELVEGETLAERISTDAPVGRLRSSLAVSANETAHRAVSTDDALPFAKQIAEALEYAHERGIIHRDLKPANIKITPQGAVKVLDFGLAKALETPLTPGPSPQGRGERGAGGLTPSLTARGEKDSGSASPSPTAGGWPAGPGEGSVGIDHSPTLTAAATQAGVIIGTAAYMSPEQARGKPVDRRADIWAFGCVLYEMLAGHKPFEGETVTDVLASVVKSEPDWHALPPDTPPRLRELLRRCLTKDPKQRLRDIGEARIAIEETISGSPSPSAPLSPAEGGPHAQVRAALPPRPLAWAAAILILLAGAAGWWLGRRSVATPPDWTGELLPGPAIAFWPRVSPDGRLLAFQAVVAGISQVVVMDPASGNWTLLTDDRSHGLVSSLCWSRDGSKVYFDRFLGQPLGIFTVPSLGGGARLVLANAANPEALPDGSLLLVRVDPDRKNQVYHYWPDTGRLQALGAWVTLNPAAPLRVFPDGQEAVFFGTAKGESKEASPHLYLMNLDTARTRRLAPELTIVQTAQLFPLAVTPDGQSVLIDLPSGNLHQIVSIPRTGTRPVRTLLTLTAAPWSLDAAPDGSLYVDQVDRPMDILKIPKSGGTPEVQASLQFFAQQPAPPLEFPGGRFALPALISGRPRVLLGKPGGSFVPLLETNEQTSPPIERVGNDEVALMIGSPPAQTLALASVKEGRILRRFAATEGKEIDDLAASPDGSTLYYVSSGSVWSVPSQGGEPRKLCAGDSVAVDPGGRDLIVSLNEQENVRLEKIPASGGAPQPIPVKGDLPVSPVPLGPNALSRDGKLLVSVAPSDSWFFGLAVLDISTGTVTRVPLNYTGDIMTPAWASEGSILAAADPMRAHLWRFRPVKSMD